MGSNPISTYCDAVCAMIRQKRVHGAVTAELTGLGTSIGEVGAAIVEDLASQGTENRYREPTAIWMRRKIPITTAR